MRHIANDAGERRGVSRVEILIAMVLAGVIPPLVTHAVNLFVANRTRAHLQSTMIQGAVSQVTSAAPVSVFLFAAVAAPPGILPGPPAFVASPR